MTIGFFHVDTGTEAAAEGYLCAKALVQSARDVMPAVRLVHFTDLKSAAVKGVDAVRRKPSEPMALLRMRHHAGVDGEWLFVDTDVVFQQPVKRVFKAAFDIAVTTRDWSHLKPAAGFSERMPFNTGVVFSRCPHFWGEVYTRLRQLDAKKQQWMGDQEVICDMVEDDSCRYQVARVKGSRYNFPPELPASVRKPEPTQAEACILHYKGPLRKPMLLARLKRESRRCA